MEAGGGDGEVSGADCDELQKSDLRSLLIEKPNRNILLFAIMSVLVFVFAVDSHSYNIGVLFFKEHGVKDIYIPLIMSSVSLFNILGSFYFEKKLTHVSNLKVHRRSLVGVSVVLFVMAVGISFASPIVTLVGIVMLQVLEPIWSTSNSVLLRSQVQKNRLGEFFGYFRIFRSLFTFAGISLYGLAQDRGGGAFIFCDYWSYYGIAAYFGKYV